MSTVAGIFRSRANAERALTNLRAAGISDERINLLTPGTSAAEVEEAVPTTETEQPGMGGALGGTVGGALGAAAGAAAGDALEESVEGLPHDELYIYEDALRQGRTVLVVVADDETQADSVRTILSQSGAESIDAARESWWVGLRDAEEAEYTGQGGDFKTDEAGYRKGFEAAQHPSVRDKSYEECVASLRGRYSDACETSAFRRGYERGHNYQRSLREK